MKNKINIIWFVNTPAFGGLERFTINLINNLSNEHIDNYLVASGSSQLFKIAETSLKSAAVFEADLPLKMGRYRGFEILCKYKISKIKKIIANHINKIAQDNKKNVVVFQTFLEKFFGTPIALNNNCKVLWIEHGPLPKWLLLNPILRFLYRQRSKPIYKIVAVSDQVEESLLKLGITQNKIKKIYNSVPKYYENANPRVIKEKINIGYIGRLEKSKGIDLLLSVSDTLNPNHFSFVFMGDGKYRSKVKNHCSKKQNAEFHDFKNDISEVLNSIDILIYPSYAQGEGLPLIILEALAGGIPVIANNTGGIGTVLTNNHNGRLIDNINVEKTIEAIHGLTDDPEIYRKYSANALVVYNSKFNYDNFLNKYLNLLENIYNSKNYDITYISGEEQISSGGIVHTIDFAHALAKKYRSISLIVPLDFPYNISLLNKDNIKIIRVPLKLFKKTFLPLGILKIKYLLKISSVTIIERYYTTGSLAKIISFFTGSPYILEVNHPHYLEVSEKYFLLKNILSKISMGSFRHCKNIITTSEYLVPEPYRKKCIIQNWGINLERFDKISRNNFYSDKKTVVFSSSFLPWHGIELLPDIMEKTIASYSNILFHIIGNGPLKSYFINKCRQLNISEKNYIVADNIDFYKIPELLKDAVLGIIPYMPEKHPNYSKVGFYWTPFKLLEYLAAGIPVVSTDNDFFINIIDKNNFGICSSASPDNFAASIVKILSDFQVWNVCHRNIKQIFTDKYSWDNFLHNLENYL